MATMREIRARLRQLGLETEYGYRHDTKLIPGILEGDEQLLQITSGVRKGQRWLLLITQRRLLLVTKPTMGAPTIVEIPREELLGAEGRKGLLFGSLTVRSSAGEYTFSNVLKKSLPQFLAELEKEPS
jgi:hypothetical protein